MTDKGVRVDCGSGGGGGVRRRRWSRRCRRRERRRKGRSRELQGFGSDWESEMRESGR